MRAALLSCLVAMVPASEELFQAFDARPTSPDVSWRTSDEARIDAEAADRDGSGSLRFDRQQVGASWLGWRGERDEGWLNLRTVRSGISGDALLPSGDSPAGTYLDATTGATWKHLLGGGDLIGGAANATWQGQPGVTDGMEWGGNASVFGRIGLGEQGRDGLLLALNYDADRIIFAEVPVLPLVAWQGVRGSWFLLLGVPFSVITYRDADWSATVAAGPLPAVSADRRLYGPLRLFGEARWTRQQWQRADRPRHDDRLELSHWEWSGGLRLAFGPTMRFEALGGAATARRLGEGDTDQRRDGMALQAAPFAAVRGRVTF